MTEHTEEWEPPRSTIDALNRVQQAIGGVSKDGRATEGGSYSYRRAEDLVKALHPLLAREGVIISTEDLHVLHREQPVPGRKDSWSSILVRYEFRARCAHVDDDGVSFVGLSVGLDNGDKGPGKAHTYAWKTAVQALFTIPDDDPHLDNETTPQDPPVWGGWTGVAEMEMVLDACKSRAKAIVDEPRRTHLREEMTEAGLLRNGRLPARLSIGEAQTFIDILEGIERTPPESAESVPESSVSDAKADDE